MNRILRHGDLSFTEEVIDLSKLKKIGGHGFALALGETTGHKHVIVKETGTVDVYLDPKTNEYVIAVDGKALLVHEEHKTIEVDTGIYRMKHQREYDYFSLASRTVID